MFHDALASVRPCEAADLGVFGALQSTAGVQIPCRKPDRACEVPHGKAEQSVIREEVQARKGDHSTHDRHPALGLDADAHASFAHAGNVERLNGKFSERRSNIEAESGIKVLLGLRARRGRVEVEPRGCCGNSETKLQRYPG